ncbi:hypothetical protein [Streptomyces apocyni]|uniref:hypothetical protein n=1 Tax=Streptomyces apocyni TaxID=2654677 RepID=UPI0018D04287|nr:hypothetical protein [Streptomyces apocyni]
MADLRRVLYPARNHTTIPGRVTPDGHTRTNTPRSGAGGGHSFATRLAMKATRAKTAIMVTTKATSAIANS